HFKDLSLLQSIFFFFFFFQAEDGIRDSSVTGVQTCALPISSRGWPPVVRANCASPSAPARPTPPRAPPSCSPRSSVPNGSSPARSEEHTSELQSHLNLVCRLLLEKKNKEHRDQPHDERTRRG